MGALFAEYKGVKLGINNDLIVRHTIQDLQAHDWYYKVLGKTILDSCQPGFKTLSDKTTTFLELDWGRSMSYILNIPYKIKPQTLYP